MRIALHDVSKGRAGQALPTMSLEFHSGAVRYALAETEQRPTVLGLIASGRMRPDTGRVTIDAAASPKELRRRVALVDAPDVSDPHPDITLAGMVGEELMFAGRGATPLHARRWLRRMGFEDLASVPVGSVDPAARVRIQCELAVLREGVDGVVLVSPDRHGGSPDGWWRIAAEFADRGYAMLVIVGGSAAVALERMHELDAVNASGPIEPLVLERPDAPAEAAEDLDDEQPAADEDDDLGHEDAFGDEDDDVEDQDDDLAGEDTDLADEDEPTSDEPAGPDADEPTVEDSPTGDASTEQGGAR